MRQNPRQAIPNNAQARRLSRSFQAGARYLAAVRLNSPKWRDDQVRICSARSSRSLHEGGSRKYLFKPTLDMNAKGGLPCRR